MSCTHRHQDRDHRRARSKALLTEVGLQVHDHLLNQRHQGLHGGGSIAMGDQQNDWFIMENPNLKWINEGYPHFKKHPRGNLTADLVNNSWSGGSQWL